MDSKRHENKKRKEKENSSKDSESKGEKRRVLRHEWSQTHSEVSATLDVGFPVDSNQVTLKCTDAECSITLPDGRHWECELFAPVVGEYTSLIHKPKKVVVKMVKKDPSINWCQLEKSDEPLRPDVPTQDDKEENPTTELTNPKYDYYESGANGDTVTVTLFVKSISRETLNVEFHDAGFSVRFRTKNTNSEFLELHKATEETTFVWRVNVKEPIRAAECRHRLSPCKLELILKKVVPAKWSCLELPVKKEPMAAPSNTWMPVSRSASLAAPPPVASTPIPLAAAPERAGCSEPPTLDSSAGDASSLHVPALKQEEAKVRGPFVVSWTGVPIFCNMKRVCNLSLQTHFRYTATQLARTNYRRSFSFCFLRKLSARQYMLLSQIVKIADVAFGLTTPRNAHIPLQDQGKHNMAMDLLHNFMFVKSSHLRGFRRNEVQAWSEIATVTLVCFFSSISHVYASCSNKQGPLTFRSSWPLARLLTKQIDASQVDAQWKHSLPNCLYKNNNFSTIKNKRNNTTFFWATKFTDSLRLRRRLSIFPGGGVLRVSFSPELEIEAYVSTLEFHFPCILPIKATWALFCLHATTRSSDPLKLSNIESTLDALLPQASAKVLQKFVLAARKQRPSTRCPRLVHRWNVLLTYSCHHISRMCFELLDQPRISMKCSFSGCGDASQLPSMRLLCHGINPSRLLRQLKFGDCEGAALQLRKNYPRGARLGESQKNRADYAIGAEDTCKSRGRCCRTHRPSLRKRIFSAYPLRRSRRKRGPFPSPRRATIQERKRARRTFRQAEEYFCWSPFKGTHPLGGKRRSKCSKLYLLFRFGGQKIIYKKLTMLSFNLSHAIIEVWFPSSPICRSGLDVSPYYCGPACESGGPQPVYDLFAVINHHGGMLGGHYTAFGRCTDATDTRLSEVGWRLFDDSRVNAVSDARVATSAAYMLFYRRRNAPFELSSCGVSTWRPRAATAPSQKLLKDRENLLDQEFLAQNDANNNRCHYGVATPDDASVDMDSPD
ncbi:unnamed protein product [Ixodes pacificus]